MIYLWSIWILDVQVDEKLRNNLKLLSEMVSWIYPSIYYN